MAKKKYEEANIQAIAETIREKTGTENTYDTSEMASGVTEVYEAGKQKEWSDFWDLFQQNGTRKNYNYACYQDAGHPVNNKFWTDANFKPKYDIKPTTANRGFMGLSVTDFVKCLDDMGVEFDLSQCGYMPNIFAKVLTWRLPILDLSKTRTISSLVAYSYSLKKISKIIWGENITEANGSFRDCAVLAEFESEGTLAISVSFASCPLTVETMKGLIRCLKNYAGTDSEGTYTLTLKDECKTALQADTETVELDGVSYTYFELITAKGWNLA